MRWITLRPRPFNQKRKPLPVDLPPKALSEEARLLPMRWRIDPNSQAADALWALRKKL